MTFQNEFKLKEFMCEIGRRVYQRGFAAANDGNITVRLNDREVLCTPTMVSKRTSEVLLHLAVYKARPDVHAAVHCHPPHATAFAVAHEPIPKCILPEVEVFLGEVPISAYETPGDNRFAQTVLPYVKNCNTIILANHGTVTFGKDLEQAYFNSEIIDAYCKILILAKQLGPINYFSEEKTRELLALKKRLGYTDPRLDNPNCDICGDGVLANADPNFVLHPQVFVRDEPKPTPALPAQGDFDKLVQSITDQVMSSMKKGA
jgi:L-fuculose-phosphate aldolase